MLLDAYQHSLFSHPPSTDPLGLARESVLLAYKAFLRGTEEAKISWVNRCSVLAAGVYESPIPSLNEAAKLYLNKLSFSIDDEVKGSNNSNEDLYNEWKRVFGKIEDSNA